MAAFLPHRDGWGREIRISKAADGDGNQIGEAAILPMERGATHRAKAIGQDVAAFGRAGPFGGFSGKSNLRPAKARLIAEHGPGAALAFQAMAHGDAHGFASGADLELAATAGGVASDHGLGSATTIESTVLKKFERRNAGSRYACTEDGSSSWLRVNRCRSSPLFLPSPNPSPQYRLGCASARQP